MFRVVAAWVVVVVSGVMILPVALARMNDFPAYYGPLLVLWVAAVIVAALVTGQHKQK